MADDHELPIFYVKPMNDETVELLLGKDSVGSFNHDVHGVIGMHDAEKMFREIARRIGTKVREDIR